MTCRWCGLPRCDCVLVPDASARVVVPPWESVVVVLGPSVTVEAVAGAAPGMDRRAAEAAGALLETADLAGLRSVMADRRECVVGRGAPDPPNRVVVHLDAASALEQVAHGPSGEWHAALPPRRRPDAVQGPVRGFRSGIGVVEVDGGTPYDVISHNWPRPDRPAVCHAGVLGVWWELDDVTLPQIESAIDIAEHSGRPVWVDYLCIDQNDTDDKDVLIGRMGHIYSRATQGYVDCTRIPEVTTIDPRQVADLLTTAGPAPADVVRRAALRSIVEAPWFSRCWTFQEALITPDLAFYDPASGTTVGRFGELRERCLAEFRHLHSSRGHETAKREGWFGKAAAIMNYTELIDGQVSWNLGRILGARGNRDVALECDQLNSLLGILDVGCGYTGLPVTQTLDESSLLALIEACGRNGDTSWIAGEDQSIDRPALSWAPSSVHARFTTQAEADAVVWVRLTDEGPELRFHRSFPVVETIPVGPDATVVLSRLTDLGVGGDWLAEYCGIVFGTVMDDPLPIDRSLARTAFGRPGRAIQDVEDALRALLPPPAAWRADELPKYLTGMNGRFTAWIVCRTPTRRIAFMAKLVAGAQPREVLGGTPSPSTYRSTHSYLPLMVVDGAPVARRLGWVWPCVHAQLDAAEAEPDSVTRVIRR